MEIYMVVFLHFQLQSSQRIINSNLHQLYHTMPRVWLLVSFGYNGQHYNGLQHQKEENVKTVENEMISKLVLANLLPTSDYFELQKTYKWGRAARTDKGVHAVFNAISCLFTIPEKFYDSSKVLERDKLLVELKEIFEGSEIEIHGLKRVTTRFDIRQMVKSRTYSYACPLAYFTKYNAELSAEEVRKVCEKINYCCSKFKGTHNFHNYSKGLKAKDPQSKRYVLEFGCEPIEGKWLKFTIRGQSFIYHQIRKIIGIMIETFMNDYDPGYIDNTFFNNQIHIPLAPPFGLFLQQLHFDSYNRKNDIPEKLQFQKEEGQLQKIQKSILQHIFSLPESKWTAWYQETREGIVPKFEEDCEKERQFGDDC